MQLSAVVMLEQYGPLLGYSAVLKSLQEAHIRAGGKGRILIFLNNSFVLCMTHSAISWIPHRKFDSFNGLRELSCYDLYVNTDIIHILLSYWYVHL